MRMCSWHISELHCSAKKAYYENAFNNCCGDQRKTWKTINELTSEKSNKTAINEMNIMGQILEIRDVKLLFQRN